MKRNNITEMLQLRNALKWKYSDLNDSCLRTNITTTQLLEKIGLIATKNLNPIIYEKNQQMK